ncbi:hypothetical protein SERLADRAFT_412199 [Serpula lacrymans var. lacrymans S7.9]|uniref:Uncharacterized protein n=1 Tax=Serpula lacrymans var. lacrymans (strain S7.9) TaxID=578457 RepID=F8PEE4_SERL9|nr:uncharacterized protein SERLADRAFT_412199 [Serpula lacrymans var. lacrymans S7.9]EGO18476.1 hypothetical protein SERLADRAFT_412199 [Serpula lacrymans var. lacrymans S7.9]
MLAQRTTLTESQLIDLWLRTQAQKANTQNHWNYYRILEAHDRATAYAGTRQTVLQHSADFAKARRRIIQTRIVTYWDCEAAIVMAGSCVNQDVTLAFLHATSGAENQEPMCKGSSEALEGAGNKKDVPVVIRKLISSQLAGLGHDFVSGKLFPWKGMVKELAKRGITCINWHNGVLLPGDEQCNTAKPKGILDLTLSERSILVNSLQDKSSKHLHFKCVPDMKKPIIQGAAPLHDSLNLHGLRKFYKGSVDHKEEPREIDHSGSKVKRPKKKVPSAPSITTISGVEEQEEEEAPKEPPAQKVFRTSRQVTRMVDRKGMGLALSDSKDNNSHNEQEDDDNSNHDVKLGHKCKAKAAPST